MFTARSSEGFLKMAREGAKSAKVLNAEELSAVAVYAAFHIHKELGPGLLEFV